MNYIELINNFWALNKEYSFTPNEKAVYFALLNKCNELGWKNPFNQSNGYVAIESGMSESAMQKARNILQQKGLIKFRSGDGRRRNTEYQIISSQKDIEKGKFKTTLSRTLSRTLSDEKRTDNIKHKTKLNSMYSTHTHEEVELFEKFVAWMQNKTPRVLQMKQPLTIDEYFKLKNCLSAETLENVLLAMENRAALLKKYVSAYLTIKSWAKHESNGSNGKNYTNEALKLA